MMTKNWLLADALGLRRPAPDPATAPYRVFVRDLVLMASIGIYDFEKLTPQRVRISTDLMVDARLDSASEDFGRVLNYETIVNGIKAILAAGHINLCETLAERIIDFCLTDPRVEVVRVMVEKLDIYPEAESVGVSIERRRDERAHP